MNRPLHPYAAIERDTVRSHLVANIALDYDFDRMQPADMHDFGFLMDAPEAMPAGSCYSISISISVHQSQAYRR